MKNKEKYKNELVDVIKNDGRLCEFMKKHGVFRVLGRGNESDCASLFCTSCGTILQLWLDEEYEVDWDNVPVDTLVRVRDNKNDKWALRYFCERKENGVYMTFPNGRTSKTAKYYTKEIWKYCELVEDEEDGSN